MPLATLSIDIEAKLARLTTDMAKAERVIDRFVTSTRSKFTSNLFAVFGGTSLTSALEASLTRLGALFPDLIAGAAKFQDLSEETNASAVALAGMSTAAAVSGVSVDDLATRMVRLTSNLANVTTETKGAGKGIAALGLNVADFRKLRPDQQIEQLATAFDGFQDSAAKTAIAVALFGRGGADVLKFFKEYVSEGGQVNRITGEQIERADRFSDAQARMRAELRATATQFAIAAIPAVEAIGTAFVETAKAVLGFTEQADDLARSRAILDFAEPTAIAIATVGESLIGLAKLARAVGGSFEAVAADIALPFQIALAAGGVLTGKSIKEAALDVVQAINDRNTTVHKANQRYVELWNEDGTKLSTALRKSFAEQRRALDEDNQREAKRFAQRAKDIANTKRALKFEADDPDAKKREAEFKRIMAQIEERTRAAQLELETGEKLKDADRLRLDIIAQLEKSTTGLSKAERNAIQNKLDQGVATLKLLDAQQESIKLRSADAKALAQELGAQADVTKGLRDQFEEIGLTREQLDELVITRERHRLALVDEKIAALSLFAQDQRELDQLRLVSAAIREQIDLRVTSRDKERKLLRDPAFGARQGIDDFNREVAEVAVATRRATNDSLNALVSDMDDSLRQGKLTVRSFVDTVVAELVRIKLLKPFVSFLTEGGLGGFLSFLFSADGNAFSAGKVQAFAKGGILGKNGGVFERPTVFSIPGRGIGIGGEAGDEGVLPLKRSRDGRLGVSAEGMGGRSVAIHYAPQFNIDSRADIATVQRVTAETSRQSHRLLMEQLHTMGVV